jgi:hypothetical protein
MQIASGKVIGGRVELDGASPEGATVTVIAREADETFEVDADTEPILLRAIEQCELGDTMPMTDLFGERRARE